MCGIAGIYSRRGLAEQGALERAAAALAHRGPDGQGIYLDGAVGLAHTRLSIIDLAQGGQPLFSADRNVVLIVNGEIYNYVELRDSFVARGYCFATHSDSETVLAAYVIYGMDFLQHLEGMFALALYDRKSGRLILARDRLGIKPLFFCNNDDGFYFGSELKALFAARPVSKEIAPTALMQFMQHGYVAGTHTLVKGIERLAPGEALCVGVKGIERQWKYWSIEQLEFRQRSFTDATEEFDQLMHQVMRQHLRSDVPFGLFLSGGVDSSCLLALMAQLTNEPVRTYSVGFSEASVHNELTAATRMAELFGTQHTVLELEKDELLQVLPYTVWAADELMADYANLPVALLSQWAAHDVKVVLSGEGGDEVFAGYGAYRVPQLKRLVRNLLYPGTRGFRASKVISNTWCSRLFRSELAATSTHWRDPFIDAWSSLPNGMTDLARMQATDMLTWLPDDLLVKADRIMMAFGLEGRVPFLDHRVVEFGLALPPGLKIEGRTGKVFLRRWAERYLPHDHLWSRKRGFTVPVAEWLSKPELLTSLGRQLTVHPGVVAWCRPEGIDQLIRRQLARGDMTMPLWRLWQFALWHTIFVQRGGARPALQTNPLEILGQ